MADRQHKTLKRPSSAEKKEEITNDIVVPTAAVASFRNLLDESAKEAFRRPWHRLERGLRLNRLRMYIEEVSAQCSFVQEEKDRFFVFLQNALDRKLLNTHKIVEYLPELQKIKSIKGLEVRRSPTGEAKWGFVRVKKADGTRRVKRPTGVAGTTGTTGTTGIAGIAGTGTIAQEKLEESESTNP
jgi:hypothetical protein